MLALKSMMMLLMKMVLYFTKDACCRSNIKWKKMRYDETLSLPLFFFFSYSNSFWIRISIFPGQQWLLNVWGLFNEMRWSSNKTLGRTIHPPKKKRKIYFYFSFFFFHIIHILILPHCTSNILFFFVVIVIQTYSPTV